MLYVLIFSLAAVLLVVVFLTTVSRRCKGRSAEEAGGVGSPTHVTHAAHGTRHARRCGGTPESQGQARAIEARPPQAPL